MVARAAHKLVRQLKDASFDEDKLEAYSLLIQSGSSDLQIAVLDSRNAKVLLLEDHVFPDAKTTEEVLSATKDLFFSHSLLQAGFWGDVTVGFKNNTFVQVPKSLFLEESAAEYLRFNARPSDQPEQILWSESYRSDAVTIFSIPSPVHELFAGYYLRKPCRFAHQASAIIAGSLSCAWDATPALYLFVDRFRIHITALKEGKLLFYNQFAIRQFQDYVRYIMLVMDELGLDQSTCKVNLWGYVSRTSPHYQELGKYIRNMTLGGRPGGIRFAAGLEDIQDHQFFDLFSLILTGQQS